MPLVGIVSGRCFAGNAALLGCCHVIIATPDANIGMGGPAMIEGGGLGVFAPEDIGPVSVQVPNGVVDVLCADEKQAVEAARHYLAYFQGDVREWSVPDQELLRDVVPPIGAGSTTSGGCSSWWPTRGRSSSCAPPSRPAW